jgi:transcriptional regulator with XRE-family HTH domain
MLLRQALGEVLRETRNDQRRTLRWLASQANTSISYISEIELGKKEVSSEILEQLANALGVPVAHLVIETGYKMSGVPDTAKELFVADEYADLIPRYELVTN